MNKVNALGSKPNWSSVFESKCEYFAKLNIYLGTCLAMITIPEIEERHFPPFQEDFEAMCKILNDLNVDREEQNLISRESLFDFWKGVNHDYFEAINIKELDEVSDKLMLVISQISILNGWVAEYFKIENDYGLPEDVLLL